MSDSELTRAPDPYEAEYMSGEPVLYRDKIKAATGFHVLVGVAFLIPLLALASVVWAAVSTGQAVPLQAFIGPVLLTLFLSLLWILFSILRVTVTQRSVYIQYGLFGPRIPLERIERSEAAACDWKRYGGWGIRRGNDGSRAYNIIGDAGRAVRIVWRDDAGKEQVYLVASPNPEGLAQAIERARARVGGRVAAGAKASGARLAPTPVRAAGAPVLDADAEFEAEAEAEAERDVVAAERMTSESDEHVTRGDTKPAKR
ncbi:hypothetical protein [Chondromyces crocatus]|uniref:Uncharacterized protein n=1 Tax=Chondromyces crocatus TaxID=52 RepID=A0A0K1EQI0_CHOCO|nr:hypothetical protein [Chondromyces crocatus]AKT43059.1 uncharacterized protein CMC5_072860 [Chondromyces crocatus]